MSKAVMLSIRPKWCEKIIIGEKTIEVRKTRPKLETPFMCYIYCTSGRPDLNIPISPERLMQDYLDTGSMKSLNCPLGNGKVIGEFTCERIYKIDKDSTDFLFKAEGLSVYKQAAEEKCGLRVAMTDDELHGYLGHCQGYGWHISDLRIYDAPRELSEFQRATNPCDSCHAEYTWKCTDCKKIGGDIKHPPQSWCYVEEG
jgi:predicted transcriptional regulator